MRFNYNKIYYAIYNAKHKDTLPAWDKFPMIVPIYVRDRMLLGINLHWIPIGYKLPHLMLLRELYDFYDKAEDKRKINLARLYYKAIYNTPLGPSGKRAIRKYYVNRIMKVKELVDFSDKRMFKDHPEKFIWNTTDHNKFLRMD